MYHNRIIRHRRLLSWLVLAAQLLWFVQLGASIERDRTMIEAGLTFGTKTGLLFGIKYFIFDNVALGVDLVGAPAGRVHLGFGFDLSYYPPFVDGYSYLVAGLSYMYGLVELARGDDIVPVQSSIWALNVGIGANSPTFQLQPVVESQNKNDVPTALYLELGLGRILRQTTRRNGVVVDMGDQNATKRWFFPNVEFGLRQGPFKPSWVQ